ARTGRALAGAIAGAILSSSLVFAVIGRTLYFDVLMTALLSGALVCLYLAIEGNRRPPVVAAGALLGLATLAKGLVAPFLAALAVAVYLVARRAGWPVWRRLLDPWAVAAFLAVALPWHVAAALAREEFVWFYVVNEHLGRFLGTREPHDYYSGPVWYYVPRAFLYLAPWTVVLPLLFVRRRTLAEPADRLPLFLWCWAGSAFVFFSLAGNKANYYLVAAAAPLALLLARRIAAWVEAARSRHLWLLAGATYGVTLASMGGIDAACGPDLGQLYPFCERVTPASYLPIPIALAIASFAGLAARGTVWRPLVPLLAVAFLSVPLQAFVRDAARHYEDRLSQRGLVRALSAIDDGRPLFVYWKLSDISSLRFYAGRDVILVDSRDSDLEPARRLPEAADRFVTLDEFDARAARAPVHMVTENWLLPLLTQGARAERLCVAAAAGATSVLTNVRAECAVPVAGTGT
ncbi:MAG: ArnT family glycosyltransferase, partial [Tagaea sp.]